MLALKGNASAHEERLNIAPGPEEMRIGAECPTNPGLAHHDERGAVRKRESRNLGREIAEQIYRTSPPERVDLHQQEIIRLDSLEQDVHIGNRHSGACRHMEQSERLVQD